MSLGKKNFEELRKEAEELLLYLNVINPTISMLDCEDLKLAHKQLEDITHEMYTRYPGQGDSWFRVIVQKQIEVVKKRMGDLTPEEEVNG